MSLLDRVFASLRHRLHLPESKTRSRIQSSIRDIDARVASIESRVNSVGEGTLSQLRDVEKRIGRMSRRFDRVEKAIEGDRLYIKRIDRAVRRGDGAHAGPDEVPPAPWPVIDEDWWILSECPVCGHDESHCVSEFNRFLVNGRAPEDGFEIYNYSLCHACGVVFAARRPRGRRFRALLEGFTENLGRMPGNNPVLNSRPLTPTDREILERRSAHGALVSEHLDIPRHEWIPGLQADRLANAHHVELLGSLLDLRGPRVLEVRSRTGAILASLRRLYGADVYAMSIFESQQHLARTVYGIRADALIDFERFSIPYDGSFDLIISNHMLTHAVTPRAFLATVHERLADGGHLYLYNEPDDHEFLGAGQSMFRVLNPFHLQTFDRPSLERLLQANGFEPMFIGHTEVNFFCLARKSASRQFTPLAPGALAERAAAYERARDAAILRLDDAAQARFARELPTVTARAVVAGTADLDDRGRLLLGNKRAAAEGSTGDAFH